MRAGLVTAFHFFVGKSTRVSGFAHKLKRIHAASNRLFLMSPVTLQQRVTFLRHD